MRTSEHNLTLFWKSPEYILWRVSSNIFTEKGHPMAQLETTENASPIQHASLFLTNHLVGFILSKTAVTNQNQLLTYELTATQWFLLVFLLMLWPQYLDLWNNLVCVTELSPGRQWILVPLLCCECEDSEIFSDSNVRRYLSFYSLWWFRWKSF